MHTVTSLSCFHSQDILCTGPNMSGAALSHVPPSSSSQSQADVPGSFTPTLAAHFDETLIRHIQGWPSENTEKQVQFSSVFVKVQLKEVDDSRHTSSRQASRLHEDIHNMGSLYMSEICTEMKNLRSLVRVCEIQATLREQR